MNAANKSVEYFSSLKRDTDPDDTEYVCPELSNPCDFFMSMMSKESIEFKKEEGEQIEDVDEAYQRKIEFLVSKYEGNHMQLRNDYTYEHPDCQQINGGAITATTPWCYQFNLLAKRNFLNLIRLP